MTVSRRGADLLVRFVAISALSVLTNACVRNGQHDVDDGSGAGSSPNALTIPIERHTLDNGLRVVLSPDTSSPIVSVAVYYDVGSRNETPGHSGFAHFFEHMMFEGSVNVGSAEHFQLVDGAGGSSNGTTDHDRTNYYETLPSHQLALGLWLEADRMQSLVITEDNFDNQRSAVINEYRQNYENEAYGLASIRITALAFGDYFPYANPTIGTVTDLNDATWQDAVAWYRSWYGPNNAVLVVVGDFQPDAAMALINEHFGDIPRREVPDWEDPGLAPQTAERTEVLEDRLARLPAVFQAYHIPPSRDDDHYALELLGLVLGDGNSSRLHRSLVEERQLCVQAWASTDGRRGPDLFNIGCVVAMGHQPAEVRGVVDEELARLVRDGITERELTKVRNRIRSSFVFGLQTTMQQSVMLAEFELFYGNAELLRTEIDRYLDVTADQIQSVAARYLLPTNRSVLAVVPAPPAPPPPAAETAAAEQPAEEGGEQ